MNTPAERHSQGVVLPEGHTGSSFFHAVLRDALAQFPAALGGARFPEQSSTFKRDYGSSLPRFEAARVASPQRVEIARFIVQRAQAALQFVEGSTRMSLSEHLRTEQAPPELETIEFESAPGLRVVVPFEGELYRGLEVLRLIDRLYDDQHMTSAARAGLRWIVEHIEARGGALSLKGHSFALLGAGAELAPTRALLAAGARVLWVDLADPRALAHGNGSLSGQLLRAKTACNLLENPGAIAAALRRFAADSGGPVQIGMFAYASGASQEWRLGAAMNAIVSRLDPATVRSVAMLVSPTSPASLQPECVAQSDAGLARAARWKSALRRAGLLRVPGYFSDGPARIARATVSIQGLSYQAAQYISKLMAAETYAVYGSDSTAAEPRPLTVSANVAGITRTRSLAHPVFQAAFLGAPHFGVRIFDPGTTRALSALLILHDLLNPNAPGASAASPGDPSRKVAQLLSQQVHGGLYSLPFVLEDAIRIAALIGMGRRPSLLLGKKDRSSSAVQLQSDHAL